MLSLKTYSLFVIYLTIYVFSQVAYKKCLVAAAAETMTTLAANKDMRFCIENHQTSMSTTLKTFWQDAQSECELDVKRSIELFRQLMLNADTNTSTAADHCTLLMRHQIRKNVMKTMIAKVEEAFVMHSWASNAELKENLKALYDIDKRVVQYIFEHVFSEVHLFLEPAELIKTLVVMREKELQIMALNCLLSKYLLDNQEGFSLVPLLTFHINQLYEKGLKSLSPSPIQALERLYHYLPEELRMFYETSNHRIGLLNQGHWEYLYAPRDNGPDKERRLALTWTQDKNTTDSDGHLTVTFNNNGLVAFASRYGAADLKYLYADMEHRAVYFWLGSGMKSSQWWHVIWPHATFSAAGERYLLFRNDETSELLCATTAYDENRRYATLLNGKDNMDNTACHWQVTRF